MNKRELIPANNKKKQESIGFERTLPSIPSGCSATENPDFICFDHYGLLFCDGSTFCSLSFTSNKYLQQNGEWNGKN